MARYGLFEPQSGGHGEQAWGDTQRISGPLRVGHLKETLGLEAARQGV